MKGQAIDHTLNPNALFSVSLKRVKLYWAERKVLISRQDCLLEQTMAAPTQQFAVGGQNLNIVQFKEGTTLFVSKAEIKVFEKNGFGMASQEKVKNFFLRKCWFWSLALVHTSFIVSIFNPLSNSCYTNNT